MCVSAEALIDVIADLTKDDKIKIFAMIYSFENAHATEDDVSWLRNELTPDQWRAHIVLLETEAAEEPHMAASINRTIQFIQERILEERA